MQKEKHRGKQGKMGKEGLKEEVLKELRHPLSSLDLGKWLSPGKYCDRIAKEYSKEMNVSQVRKFFHEVKRRKTS